jgi:hypothetical protein
MNYSTHCKSIEIVIENASYNGFIYLVSVNFSFNSLTFSHIALITRLDKAISARLPYVSDTLAIRE